MAEPYPYRVPWEEIEHAARRDAGELGPATLVSVDWDFFLPPPDLSRFDDERAEMLAAGAGFYLEEWFGALRQLRLWGEIADRLRVLGAEPAEIWEVEDPSPLARELGLRYRFRRAFVCDSHLWGAYVAARMHAESGEAVQLVSFDAHHDLGYLNYAGDAVERSRRRAWERPSCDDWAQACIRRGVIGRMELAYPYWRGLAELERSAPTISAELLKRHVWVGEFDEWVGRHPAPAQPLEADLLLVRSSAYAHPFGRADERFLGLARELAPAGFVCLDCEGPLAIGAMDACLPRPSH